MSRSPNEEWSPMGLKHNKRQTRSVVGEERKAKRLFSKVTTRDPAVNHKDNTGLISQSGPYALDPADFQCFSIFAVLYFIFHGAWLLDGLERQPPDKLMPAVVTASAGIIGKVHPICTKKMPDQVQALQEKFTRSSRLPSSFVRSRENIRLNFTSRTRRKAYGKCAVSHCCITLNFFFLRSKQTWIF